MAGGRDEKSLTPMRGFEIISTNYGFTHSFFILILGLVWTALTFYFSTIYFWNVVKSGRRSRRFSTVSLGGFDLSAGGPKSVDRWRLSFANPMLSEGAAKARDEGKRATWTRRSEEGTGFWGPLMRGRPGQDSFFWGGPW